MRGPTRFLCATRVCVFSKRFLRGGDRRTSSTNSRTFSRTTWVAGSFYSRAATIVEDEALNCEKELLGTINSTGSRGRCYEPWRRFVFSTLQKQPEWQVIGEASDGLEAVQKAQELQTDLILLDIGLPKLNGIGAARQIRKLAPTPRIVFLTQESSPEIVEEALGLGAEGYVVKAYAATELLTAVEAVLQGKQFVSSGIARHDVTARTKATLHSEVQSDRPLVVDSSEGIFRVDMDLPMRVDLPEEEQIQHILRDSYVADCNDAQARMYGLNSAQDLIGRRMAEMVVPDDSKNIELTREFIRSGYQVLHKKSYEVDAGGNHKVFLNSMTGVIVEGKLIATWGRQSDITEKEALGRGRQ